MLEDDGGHDRTGSHDDLQVGLGGVRVACIVTELDTRGRRAGTFRQQNPPDSSLGKDYRIESDGKSQCLDRTLLARYDSLVKLSMSWLRRYPRSDHHNAQSLSRPFTLSSGEQAILNSQAVILVFPSLVLEI